MVNGYVSFTGGHTTPFLLKRKAIQLLPKNFPTAAPIAAAEKTSSKSRRSSSPRFGSMTGVDGWILPRFLAPFGAARIPLLDYLQDHPRT